MVSFNESHVEDIGSSVMVNRARRVEVIEPSSYFKEKSEQLAAELDEMRAERDRLIQAIGARDSEIARLCGQLSKRVEAADNWDRLVKATGTDSPTSLN